MCDITLLLNFDTFGTGTTPQFFAVNKSCTQVSNPFNQYCLIAPPDRLASTSTCNLEDDPDASFLFTDALAGRIQTLHDLPVLFESFLEATGSTQLWLPHTLDVVNSIANYAAGIYNGQQPLPQLISRFLVSDDNVNSLAFFNLSGGPNYVLYALDQYGMFRVQTFANGSPVQTNPATDPWYNCFQSQSGTEQFALILNVVYTKTNGVWYPLQFATNPPPIYNVLVSRGAVNCTALVGSTQLLFTQPYMPPHNFPQGTIWSCFTQDRQHLLVCGHNVIFNGYGISLFASNTGVSVQGWSISNSTVFDAPGVYQAMTNGSYTQPGSFSVFVQRPSGSSATILLLTNFTSANVVFPPNFTITSIVGQYGYILQSQPSVLQLTYAAPVVMPTTPTIVASNSTGLFFWGIFGPVMFYLQMPVAVFKQADVPLYLADAFSVNDEYKMDAASDVLVELWYLGRVFFNLPLELIANQVVGVSRHNRFRVLTTGFAPTTPTSFANVTFRLERMNDFYVLTSGAFAVSLTEDANVRAGDVWASNTPDQNSDPDTSQVWSDTSVPLVTGNGLYILFRDSLTVRVAYNVFNSARFAEWCDTTDEYRSRAIQAQADFCFANLTSATSTNLFLDLRCGCVGGARLLELAFPGLDTSANGRLEQVLPCVIDDCAKAFARGPEVSNAYLFTQETCGQDLTVCADILSTSKNAALTNVVIDHNCGTDPNACLNNAQCPIGTVCISGQCTVTCASDARCVQSLHDPFARCDTKTGQCLFSTQTKPSNQNFIYWMLIVGFIVLTLVVLLVILALFVK